MKCLNCNTEHDNKKFCSKSCLTIYNNKNRVVSDLTKKKISDSLKNGAKAKEVKKCFNCGKDHINVKFCSISCKASYHNKHREVTEITRQKLSKINKGKVGHKHSEEIKKNLSNKMKEYYLNNPDKHFWTNKEKFISKPCEFFKKKLIDKNFVFIEEYIPLKDYNYSIDIAFVDYKIGIEINGNQHYKIGQSGLYLNDYYQKRHDLIEKEGWFLVELHYKTVYDKNIDEIINNIFNKLFHYDFNTNEYLNNFVNKK